MYFRKWTKLVVVFALALFAFAGFHNDSVEAKVKTSTRKTYYSNKKVKYKYVDKKNGKKMESYTRYTYSKKGKLTHKKIVRYVKGKRSLVTFYKYHGKKAKKTSRTYYYNTFSKKAKPTKRAFAKRTYKSNGKTKKVKYYTKAGKRSAVASKVKSYVGHRYRSGGTSPKGFDCSGLTSYVMKKTINKNIGRTTYAQTKKGKYVKVSSKKLQPGDLLFFGSKGSPYHVGMYIGKGKYVHASTPKTGVRYDKLSNYKPSYAKRVI